VLVVAFEKTDVSVALESWLEYYAVSANQNFEFNADPTE
jgi:hypothetical protein